MMEEQTYMVRQKCKLQGHNGIQQLDRVGPYLGIANRQLHETGEARRHALVNEARLWGHRIHGCQQVDVISAQKHNQ